MTPKQHHDLLAIYHDYAYFVRKLEQLEQKVSIRNIAYWQISKLYKNPKEATFPWRITRVSEQEKQEYQNFIAENIHNNTGTAYISLRHTNPQKDSLTPISYVPDQYRLMTMDMDLPCPVERYIVAYPENSVIGNTPFYIDGKYKAVYTQKENADTPVGEIFNNNNVQTEFRILMNMIDYFDTPEHLNADTRQARPDIYNIFASEILATFENTILETLGSFAEKCQEISRFIYKGSSYAHPLHQAEKNGFIPSADKFQGYVNIRHLIRHQWDTLDELGRFNESSSQKNMQLRGSFLQSYLDLCDKPIKERIKGYADVLKQLQSVIGVVYPDILFREASESNSKFMERVKEYQRNHPNEAIKIITNYPLEHPKRTPLLRNLHKVLSNAQIFDEYEKHDYEFETLQTDYLYRAAFLRYYHNTECLMMTYCLTRGKDLRGKAVWDYFQKNKILSAQEYQTWQTYIRLRNDLSHNHYSPDLRRQVYASEEKFLHHVIVLENRINAMFPDLKWVAPNVYRCKHPDGQKVTLNFATHQILSKAKPAPQNTEHQKTKTHDRDVIETFAGGLEIATRDRQIISVSTPDNIKINFRKRRIVWPNNIKWHTNAEYFNVLQTEQDKLLTDKNLHVIQFLNRDKPQQLRAGDTYLLDHKHLVVFDRNRFLQSLSVKDDNNHKSVTRFRRLNDKVQMTLPDTTCITFEGDQMSVSHNGQKLTYENRQQFAATYSAETSALPQFVHTGHVL